MYISLHGNPFWVNYAKSKKKNEGHDTEKKTIKHQRTKQMKNLKH